MSFPEGGHSNSTLSPSDSLFKLKFPSLFDRITDDGEDGGRGGALGGDGGRGGGGGGGSTALDK